jgi:hypothetical protein
VITEQVIDNFADWCTIWADEQPGEEFRKDYREHYEVVWTDGAWFLVIHVRLGAFDHGAGDSILVVMGDDQFVAYEGTVTQFASGKTLGGLP